MMGNGLWAKVRDGLIAIGRMLFRSKTSSAAVTPDATVSRQVRRQQERLARKGRSM